MRHGSVSDYGSSWRSTLTLALVIGLPFAVFVPSVARAAGALALGVVLVLSFHELLRIDRTAFASIAIPSAAVVLLGLVLPWRIALGLDEGVAVFFSLFPFARGSFVPWWWRVVLRRPEGAFAIKLADGLHDISAFAKPALLKGDDRSIASIDRHLDRVRTLDPPTNEWSALRDAYVNQWETTLALVRRSASEHDWEAEAEKARRTDLQARFDELAARR